MTKEDIQEYLEFVLHLQKSLRKANEFADIVPIAGELMTFVDQRVIEELERWIEKGEDDGGGVFAHELYQRVNELSTKKRVKTR